MRTSPSRQSSRASHTRKILGAVISVCLVAVVAIAVGIGFLMTSGGNPLSAGSIFPALQDDSVVLDENGVPLEVDVPPESEYERVEQEAAGVIYEKGEVLLIVDEDTSVDAINAFLAECDFAETKDVSGQKLSYGFASITLSEGASVLGAVDAFENAGITAQPNYILQACEAPEPSSLETAVEYSASEQWMLGSVNAYKAWDIQKAGEPVDNKGRVAVAVIDTGCNLDHVDLDDNIVGQYNAYNAEQNAKNTNNGIATRYDTADVDDTSGHGTHVAGIVAAEADNHEGIQGVSYNAGLVPIKATNSQGMFDVSTIAVAIGWLLEKVDDENTRADEMNVRVINMSIGGLANLDGDDNPIMPANHVLFRNIRKAYNDGILVVAAAGNTDTEHGMVPPYYSIPGDYDYCLSVINLEKTGESNPNDSGRVNRVAKASGSNFNHSDKTASSSYTKDISAPGTYIRSTYKTNEVSYAIMSGTSMASPCVAGVAALAFANNPDLGADQVMPLLEATATSLGGAVWTQEYGYGEVDAYAALLVTSARISTESVPYKGTADLNLVYGGTTQPAAADCPEWTWSLDRQEGDTGDARVNADGTITGLKAGTITVKATYNGTGNISTSKTIEVEPLDLADAIISPLDPEKPGFLKAPEDAPYVYCASAIEPDVLVSYLGADGQPFELGYESDYVVEYADNVNAGVGTVTIKPVEGGNFTGKQESKFNIGPRDLEYTAITPVPIQEYTGGQIRPEPIVYFLNDKLTLGENYTLSYGDNTEMGVEAGSVTITGSGNFTGSTTLYFDIAQDINQVTLDSPPVGGTYTGKPYEPKVVLTHDGKTLVEGTDYFLEYANNVHAGQAAQAIVTGIHPYTNSMPCYFAITARSIKDGVTIHPVPDQEYTGSALYPPVVLEYNGTVLNKGTDYTVNYPSTPIVNTGTYNIRVYGLGDFSGSAIIPCKVVGMPIDGASVQAENRLFTGSAQKPKPTVTLNGVTLTEGVDYTVTSYKNNTKVGTATVTISGMGKYSGTAQGNFSILVPMANASATIPSQTYTGNAIEPSFDVYADGRKLVKGTDYTVSFSNNVQARTASETNAPTATITGMGMYSGTLTKAFTISKADITKAQAQVGEYTYTGSAIKPAPTVTLNGATLVSGRDYSLSYGSNTAVGTGSVTIAGIGNYAGSKTVSFKINAPANANNTNSSGSASNNSGTSNSAQPSSSASSSNTASTPARVNPVSMYRMYNPNSGEHFYTASEAERNSLRRVGWKYEGVGWTAPSSGDPVYRLYNRNSGDHHYTLSAFERDSLKRAGWRYEGIGWYSDTNKKVPLYRQYNPNAKTGSHNFTPSTLERDSLLRAGWRNEGIAWYGI